MSSAAYDEAVATLDSAAWRRIVPGLERTRAVLSLLGNPERGMRGVLIGGTNGKGSVCATVDSVCRAAAVRTTLLTSPHLRSYCERVVIDGAAISEDGFGALIGEVRSASQALPVELQPTAFEVLTASGILAARRADAEVLVCEVGMGGRLDSTNVLDLGVVAVTNVALDHVEHLGGSIVEIAREKAAIVKGGNRVVTAAEPPALGVIAERCSRMAAKLAVIEPSGRALGAAGVLAEAEFDGAVLGVRAPLLGRFQVANVAVAVAVCDALRQTGVPIDAGAVLRGCASARWPGRMQWIDGAPALLIDGAHNPAGMAAMVESARALIGARRCAAVFAVMGDKDAGSMARTLAGLTRDVVVTAPAVSRAAPPEQLSGLFDPPAVALPDAADALREARRRAGAEGVVVVCGSLYLAGEVLGLV